MLTKLLVGLIVVLGALGLFAFLLRQHFVAQLDGLEARVRASPEPAAARIDLPQEVLDLAARLGARQGALSPFVTFDQTGEMWQAPGGDPMSFSASQTTASTALAFIWRAAFAPLGALMVADYLVDGKGGLDARALGILHIAGETNTAAVEQGEALRYLAEIPWNPDIILANMALQWGVVDSRMITVAAGRGDRRVEITFTLDDKGFIAEARAATRMRDEDGKMVPRPWHGRFSAYIEAHGRRIPSRGEVAWDLDGQEFVYWRGEVSDWEAH